MLLRTDLLQKAGIGCIATTSTVSSSSLALSASLCRIVSSSSYRGGREGRREGGRGGRGREGGRKGEGGRDAQFETGRDHEIIYYIKFFFLFFIFLIFVQLLEVGSISTPQLHSTL